MYCNVFNRGSVLRVWRLVKYTDDDPLAWQLSWKLDTRSSLVGFGADFSPLWCILSSLRSYTCGVGNKNALVLLNLRTHKFSLHKEESSSENEEKKSIDGCIMTLSDCKECMDSIYEVFVNELRGGNHTLYFSQYVLPRLFNPLPQLSPWVVFLLLAWLFSFASFHFLRFFFFFYHYRIYKDFCWLVHPLDLFSYLLPQRPTTKSYSLYLIICVVFLFCLKITVILQFNVILHIKN